MDDFDATTSDLKDWKDLVDMFSREDENIRFVICIDELSNVCKYKAGREKFTILMDSIMSFSQGTISRGGYFAVVASSLYIYDCGEVVLTGSARAMRQIRFPSITPDSEIEKRTRQIVATSGILGVAPNRECEEEFRLEVAIQVAQSSPCMSNWLLVAMSETIVRMPDGTYEIPNCMKASDVFQLAARNALRHENRLDRDVVFHMKGKKDRYHAVLHDLHGSAKLHDAKGGSNVDPDIHSNWDFAESTLSLPPYRLLQFNYERELFPDHVQKWVLVELRRLLLYFDEPSQVYRTWEVGAMAILELRKAMFLAVRHEPPSLCDIIGDGDFVKLNDNILKKSAAKETASIDVCMKLPLWSHQCQKPCVYYSRNSCEKGVEGVFRGGFGDLAIFFQMKLYQKVCAMQIKNWLIQAHRRAHDLDYRKGTYIVQLFVTGAINDNVEGHKKDWREGSVVFADEAISNLFNPFGKGVFSEMVKRHRRENRASK